jgi:hypothetical protein
MNDSGRGFPWLHLVCCGGPLLVVVLVSAAPAVGAFLTGNLWLVAVAALAFILLGARLALRKAGINGGSASQRLDGASWSCCQPDMPLRLDAHSDDEATTPIRVRHQLDQKPAARNEPPGAGVA